MSGDTPPSATAFEPRLPDVAQWFADRSLPYTHHLEAALLSSEFGITSLEEMKVIQMIEWKTLLQHDPLSSEGYGLVKWRVFQEEFRKFASEEFDGTKRSEAQQQQKKAKSGSMSSVNRGGKAALRKMKSGADLTSSAVLHSAISAGVLMSAAVLVAKTKSQRQLQQIKMLQNGGDVLKKKGSSRSNINNNNKSVSNTMMTSSTMNSFLANDGTAGGAGLKISVPSSVKQQRHDHNVQMDIDVVADLDDEFAPKADDYRTSSTAANVSPPKKVHSNSDEQDDVSTINMSSYEHSAENDDDNDNDTVLTLDEQKWNVRYADLLRYYKLHGTTHISLKANATKPRHIMLRRWADRQRKAFLHDELSEEQIEKLVAVQFDFGQDIEELVAEQIEQERIQAEQRRMEKLRLKAEAERRRLEAEKRRLEEIVMRKEMDKKRIESTYVVADVEGCVEAIYVS